MSREHRAEKAEHGGGDRERGEATGGDGQVQAVLPRRVRARRCDLCAACGGPCCSVGAEDGQGETGPEPLDGRRVDARARLVISSRAVTDVTLLAVPNVSEGRHDADVAAIGTAFTSHGARLLDTHSDPDHHRTVYTLAGRPGELSASLVGGARETLRRVDLARPRGRAPARGRARRRAARASRSSRAAERPAPRPWWSPTASATSSGCPSCSTARSRGAHPRRAAPWWARGTGGAVAQRRVAAGLRAKRAACHRWRDARRGSPAAGGVQRGARPAGGVGGGESDRRADPRGRDRRSARRAGTRAATRRSRRRRAGVDER